MRLTEFSEQSVTEATPQWKTKSKKPTGKKPPAKGNTSPHPGRGKMVGSSATEPMQGRDIEEAQEGNKIPPQKVKQFLAKLDKTMFSDVYGWEIGLAKDTNLIQKIADGKFEDYAYDVSGGDGPYFNRTPVKHKKVPALRKTRSGKMVKHPNYTTGAIRDLAWKLSGKQKGPEYEQMRGLAKEVLEDLLAGRDPFADWDRDIEEADQPKGGSARSKLNHSLTSRKSGAHKDKSKTLPRKAKHKGKVEEAPVETNSRGRVKTGRNAAPPPRVTVRSKPKPKVKESPLVTRTGNPLLQTVDGMFDDFLKTNPDTEQLKAILRIMGKSMDITGNRAVIDTLKNMGVDESMRGGDMVADIEDKLSFVRYLKQQFARSGDDPETMEEIRRKERELRGQLRAMTTEDSDPCWKSHKQVGMKKKGGKKVPNCVPK